MSRYIQRLDGQVASQIAAGEVIERPVSVVKELLENALDAGSTQIRLEVEQAGSTRICIEDNGLGIWEEDLQLAVEPHATSKIRTLEDLYHTQTKGFRGEALASIASVSKLQILSKPEQQPHAMSIQIVDGQSLLFAGIRHQGTTIEVSDLFYNVPVRKKFLKSPAIEWQAIELMVKKFSLSAPQVQLDLYHNGEEIIHFQAAQVKEEHLYRIRQLWGKRFYEQATYIDIERSGLRLWGWIGSLSDHRSQNDRLWVYLNQRMIQDKLITHALKQIYCQILPEGRHPQCVLYLEIPPQMVDINVHPTKQEVRFEQPRLIYDFILSCLRPYWNLQNVEEHYHSSSIPTSGANFSPLTSSIGSGATTSWLICNVDYVILPLSQHLFYLVDVMKWWLFHFQKQVMSWQKPWQTRVLSMPYLKDIPPISNEMRQVIETRVAEWGIDLSFWDDNRICIRSIPEFMCQLNLNQWIKVFKTNMDVDDVNLPHLFGCCTFSAYDVTASHYKMMMDDISNPEDMEKVKSFARLLDHSSCLKVFK